MVPTLAKGFGECNGINVKGGNMGNTSAVKTLSDYSSKYPGAAVVYNGSRATSPNP